MTHVSAVNTTYSNIQKQFSVVVRRTNYPLEVGERDVVAICRALVEHVAHYLVDLLVIKIALFGMSRIICE